MRPALVPSPLEAGVRAFRELTAAGADGSATRARVLARAGALARRRDRLRRLVPLVVAAALAGVSSASAAWLASARPWRAPAPEILEPAPAPAAWPARRTRVIPPLRTADDDHRDAGDRAADDDATAAARAGDGDGDGELRAYGRAHRVHFADDVPARALAAWNAYLAAYPHGTFVPEARYNRALCLVRLDRRAEARRALRPFANGRVGAYRQHEAELLLGWLAERPAPR